MGVCLHILKSSGFCVGIVLTALLTISCQKNKNPIALDNQTAGYALCYNKTIDGIWQVVLNSIGGGALKNISNNPSDDAYNPLWSPDGEYIAFRYDREYMGGCDIYLYEIDSDQNINITPELTSTESATPRLWSPDSKKLIYYYHKIGETYCYYIMNTDGTEKQKLFESKSVTLIAFCDQETSILYTQDQNLFKLNITSLSTELILNFETTSNYSIYVDGYNTNTNTILCHEDSSTWNGGLTFLIKKISLSTMETDTLVMAEYGIKLLRPVFSSDYSKVAYIERDYENHISKIILLEDDNKTELNRLTNEHEEYKIYRIEFSPNDTYITYTVGKNIPGDWLRVKSYVYVLNIANKEAHLIDEAEDSHWNPLNNF